MQASYYLVKELDVQNLSETGNLPTPISQLDIDGYYLLMLFNHLHQSNAIDLSSGVLEALAAQISEENDSTAFIISCEQARDALPKVIALAPSDNELRNYYEAFNENEDAESGFCMSKALTDLIEKLQMVEDDDLLILSVKY